MTPPHHSSNRYLGQPQTQHQSVKPRKASHVSISLDPLSTSSDGFNLSGGASVVDAIRKLATGTAKERNFLVFVNPFSGSKKATTVWANVCSELFRQAFISVELIVTQDAGHATERVADGNELSSYDGVVTVGGDGLLFEVLQGVKERSDAKEVFKNLTFGIIAAGSGNGLAKSVNHKNAEVHKPLENAFLICKGNKTRTDLATYDTSDSKAYTAFLSLSWGIVADVDLESEVLRCLGPLRLDAYAVWRMINLRKYRGRFSYFAGGGETGGMTDESMPKLGEPLGAGWEVIEDEFICFWACQTTHASYDIYSSPNSTFGDGKFHVLLVRGSCSRWKLLKSFLAFETGSHLNQKHVEVIECSAFRLEPLTTKGHLSLDGEEVEYGAIQANVNQERCSLFA